MKTIFQLSTFLFYLTILAQENIPHEVDICIQQKNKVNFERLCTPEYIYHQRHQQIKSFFEYCVDNNISIKGELYVKEKNRAILPVKISNKNNLYLGKAYLYLIRKEDLWYIDGAYFQNIGNDRSPLQKFNALFLEGKIRGFYHPEDLKPSEDIDKQAQEFLKQLKKKHKNAHTDYLWKGQAISEFIQKNQSKISFFEYLQNHCDTLLGLSVVVFSYTENNEKNYISLYFEKQGKEWICVDWEARLPRLAKFLRENEDIRH